ncbi:hypothetical protein AALO_G00177860 [Alosa alosa]|uniref:Uncharacterized protein n=1 Tax=Alosa alosa TaxID=278164 RepID=A0AAV6G9M1_9TELE|nr:hypothetical protein AALO_G00177860 [Alosa alosa]
MLIKVQYRGLKSTSNCSLVFLMKVSLKKNLCQQCQINGHVQSCSTTQIWLNMVQEVLEKSSGGEETMEEYKRLSTLTHCTRRHHILVSHIVEMHGNSGSHS